MYLENNKKTASISLFYVSSIYHWDWLLEFVKLLRNDNVRLDVKQSAIHCKDCQNITFGANITNLSLKGSRFSWKSYANDFSPIGSRLIIYLMMSTGLKFVFNLVPDPLHLHICINFSFTLPRGRLIFFKHMVQRLISYLNN